MASCLSYALGYLTLDEVKLVIRLIKAFDLPVAPPNCETDKLLDLMSHDKKVKAGSIRFVVLKQLGSAKVQAGIDETLVKAVLQLPFEALLADDFSALQALA